MALWSVVEEQVCSTADGVENELLVLRKGLASDGGCDLLKGLAEEWLVGEQVLHSEALVSTQVSD